jgi:hypothetical protein
LQSFQIDFSKSPFWWRCCGGVWVAALKDTNLKSFSDDSVSSKGRDRANPADSSVRRTRKEKDEIPTTANFQNPKLADNNAISVINNEQ